MMACTVSEAYDRLIAARARQWTPPTDEERKMWAEIAERQYSYAANGGNCGCDFPTSDDDETECAMLDSLGGETNYYFRARIAESLAMDGMACDE